jgi:hypothetical protein
MRYDLPVHSAKFDIVATGLFITPSVVLSYFYIANEIVI